MSEGECVNCGEVGNWCQCETPERPKLDNCDHKNDEQNTGMSIGICNGLGEVIVNLNGYGKDRSYPDVIQAAQRFIERTFPGKAWRRLRTDVDSVTFE